MSIAHYVLPSIATTFRRSYLGGGLVAFVVVAHAATDAITSTVGALLPSIQLRLALTESSVALLIAVLAVGASLAQPFLGALADRVGREQPGLLELREHDAPLAGARPRRRS